MNSVPLCSRMSSIVESEAGFTALPCAMSSKRCAISLGVVTPSPYFTELSIATLELRRKLFECTRVCWRPSESIFAHRRLIDLEHSERIVERELTFRHQVVYRHQYRDLDQAGGRKCLIASSADARAALEIDDAITDYPMVRIGNRIELLA